MSGEELPRRGRLLGERAAPAEQVGCVGGGCPAGSGSSLWPRPDPGPSGRPALLVYALRSAICEWVGRHAAVHPFGLLAVDFFPSPGRLHPVSPAGLWQPAPASDSPPPCTSSCEQLSSQQRPLQHLLSLPSGSAPAVGATQEARGQGQPAIPDQGYLLLLLLLIFCCCYSPAESETRTQAGSREPSLPGGATHRRSRGRGRGLGAGAQEGELGTRGQDGPVCPGIC